MMRIRCGALWLWRRHHDDGGGYLGWFCREFEVLAGFPAGQKVSGVGRQQVAGLAGGDDEEALVEV